VSDEGIDLRALLDVQEPDVVRAALHRFRRRLLTRYLWLSLALLITAGAIVWGLQPATLEQKIRSATGVEIPGAVWHLDHVTIGLAEVVPLKDSVGLHFVLIPTRGDTTTNHTYRLETDGSIDEQRDVNGFDTYVQVPRTADGRYIFTVVDQDSLRPPGTFVLDLAASYIPTSVWKET